MITFVLSLVALVLGYFIYGKVVEKIFKPDNRETPAVRINDGVDYLVMPSWKVFMIQFLNIAGTGPIFGAIMGMWFGTSAYLWIVFGCIFAGAVHDYFSGMLSMRHDGCGLPVLVGQFLGNNVKQVMLVFSVFLLVMVGVVFVYSPAIILEDIWANRIFWIFVIFVYYIIATLLPIDKIIGKIYPLFAFSLLFMAVALMIGLFIKQPQLPEVWEGLSNLGAEQFGMSSPIFPALFITIACGAISGFHATQSPLMSRCLKSEKMGRPVFYGAMITEGMVALIWATISSYFFFYGGWKEVAPADLVMQYEQSGKTLIQFFDAPTVVKLVCSSWLGIFGGILALLGVVAAPITSGDTAFRSARLIIAEFLHLEQRTMAKRLIVAVPMFAASIAFLFWQIENPDGFNIIWQYFGWSNQTLSVFTLWAITVYLVREKKPYVVTLIPAVFMTVVCITFILVSKNGFGLSETVGYGIAGATMILSFAWFFTWKTKSGRCQI
ncbi:MAG: carbon starvation protein A [Prevotella sp.]|uniref:carbon starvation CstA family protein n=1 Tax=Prevotella sp. TaxID=59823 RepID=UPI002A2C38BD|nr:carbon starvation protein A [Prevotella sp.]MDD7318174.1 carbon starvation protein A [Prevotellaceae bacterium]MDY4020937.1 carbon starvation protein A [Prevotella sp.]